MFKALLILLTMMPGVALAQLTISTPPSLPVATVNQAYSTQLTATGGVTPYQWHFEQGSNPSPRFSLSSTGLLTGTPVSADLGVQTFYIQVTDYSGATVTKQFSVTVQSTQPLSLTTAAFTPGVAGVPYSLQLTSTGGVPPLNWAVLPAIVTFPVPGQVAPGLMLNASTGLVSGTPTVPASYNFTITLTDSANGSVSKVYTLVISAGGPLSITTASLPNGTVGAAYSQTAQATGGVPPYKWSLATGALPAGLSLDPNAGVISGAPTASGTSAFTLQATDSAATPAIAKQALTVVVASPPQLTITTSTLPGAMQSAPYSQQIAASGGISPYHWTLSSGSLPAGLSLGAANGIVSGTPGATGTFTFTVQVSDSAAVTANTTTKSFGITVTQLTPVSVGSGPLPGGTANTPYSQVLTASGGASPYSWIVVTGSLPPGTLLSSTGTLSGVPSAAGTFTFTVQLTDASGASQLATYSVAIAPASLSPAPILLPSGVVGVSYPQQIVTANAGSPPYTFSLQSGMLPAGLNLSNTGIISGTPTATGTSNFTLQTADSAQGTVTADYQIVIRPASPPDLVLSVGALSFSLATGASGVPSSQAVAVASSSVSTALAYQVTVNPAAPWISVTGGLNGSANTPGGLSVALNNQALSLGTAGSPYTTSIVVTCMSPSPCAGNSQKVAVTLSVTAPPPQLMLTTTVLSLTPVGKVETGAFGLSNAGGGTITVNSVTTADSWLSVTGVPATIPPGPPVYATVTANPMTSPGLYRSTITIATSAGSANLPVTMLIPASATLSLSPAGQQFQMTAGGAVGNPNSTVEVVAAGASTVNWNAATLPGASWLVTKTAAGSSTPSSPGSLSFAIDPVASAALSAGAYYGRIRVTSTQVANSPQDLIVVLNVAPTGTPTLPDPEPSGLLFIANGSAAIPSQGLTLYSNSTAVTPYQAAALTNSGTQWLTVSPTVGAASSSSPGHPTVSVSPTGLGPGIYRGVVTYQFSPAAVRSVNVTYIIPNTVGGLPFVRTPEPHASSTCTPANLVTTGVSLPSNFGQAAAWPTLISIMLSDDCGNAVATGVVNVTFSNGDPLLPLVPDTATAGRYSAVWTPQRAAQQVTMTATASATGFPTANAQITGTVSPNLAPVIRPGGALNAFNLAAEGNGIAPGTWVAIFGSNLAPAGTSLILQGSPFPTSAQNISVIIGGFPAPLYYVSPTQINAQVPYELMTNAPNNQVIVNANGALANLSITASPGAPGIATLPNNGIIAQHLDGSLVTETSPAKPGEALVFYLTGLGTAANEPADGYGAPLPPTGPVNPVTVNMNGTAIPTLFIGLTPGAVGLYQINLYVPTGTPDGDQIVTVSQAGAVSNVTILPVHQ